MQSTGAPCLFRTGTLIEIESRTVRRSRTYCRNNIQSTSSRLPDFPEGKAEYAAPLRVHPPQRRCCKKSETSLRRMICKIAKGNGLFMALRCLYFCGIIAVRIVIRIGTSRKNRIGFEKSVTFCGSGASVFVEKSGVPPALRTVIYGKRKKRDRILQLCNNYVTTL